MADDSTSDNDGGLGGDKKDSPAQKKQVKNEHILIIVGVVTLVVMVIMARNKKNQSSQSATTTAQSPYGVNSYGAQAQDPYGYGNAINTMASDLQSMQSEIAGLTPPTAASGTTTPYSAPTNEINWGGGYGPSWSGSTPPTGQAPITDPNGAMYDYLTSLGAAENYAASGGQLYFQPSPGVFAPTTLDAAKSGTPTYIKQ